MVEEVGLRIASDPRWLRLARLIVEQCCREFGFARSPTREIVMAVDEAVANVMRHAYRGETSRPIRIVCRCARGALEVEVWDRGGEFDPFGHPVPPPGELRRGGRGLFLIRSSMDECEYRREDGWNRIRLTKRLPAPAAGA